jgi:replicative DNA helicase
MIENYILSALVQDEEFSRKALPFLKKDYFADDGHKVIFELVRKFVDKYNKVPNKAVLSVDLDELKNLNQTTYDSAKECIKQIGTNPVLDEQWLLDNTEKFCQDKAIYNAIMDSIKIMDDQKEQQSRGTIPKLLSDALAVSFDQHIGHDFLEDSASRFENYHKKEKRIPFDIELLNKITKGGLPRKTLNIILAGTGVGKSLAMCHMAAHNLSSGQNVLYITMEMAEEKIAERIDANLLDVSLDELAVLTKDAYQKKIERFRSKTTGKLIIKEYPTASAGSANFRHLINELRLKRNFKPDIIYIDYLNICSSSRLKAGANVNSYTYVKAIAEELRGLGVEFDVPIVSATQTNRTGYTNSDVGLEDTSESFGLPATADIMIALIATEELDKLNQIMVKQLKNRYSDPTKFKRFVIGVDKSKMKLYDVETNAQQNIMDAPGSSYSTEYEGSRKMDIEKFSKFDFN